MAHILCQRTPTGLSFDLQHVTNDFGYRYYAFVAVVVAVFAILLWGP